MNLETWIPGDEVIGFLLEHGARSTDASGTFPGGRHFDNIARYVQLMETGQWEQTDRPIMLDAKTGTVWKGTDRSAAIAQVDWTKVRNPPQFFIIVEHPVTA